jgi:hypothetical protein
MVNSNTPQCYVLRTLPILLYLPTKFVQQNVRRTGQAGERFRLKGTLHLAKPRTVGQTEWADALS